LNICSPTRHRLGRGDSQSPRPEIREGADFDPPPRGG